MKSVFTTFSQNTMRIACNLCLSFLCVFVFSSVGNAQSFKSLDESRHILASAVSSVDGRNESSSFDANQVIKTEDNNGTTILSPTVVYNHDSAGDPEIAKRYFRNLVMYLGTVDKPNVVSVAIQENHNRMLSLYPDDATYVEALRQEVTDLLSN